jgi:hypothetical protein
MKHLLDLGNGYIVNAYAVTGLAQIQKYVVDRSTRGLGRHMGVVREDTTWISVPHGPQESLYIITTDKEAPQLCERINKFLMQFVESA